MKELFAILIKIVFEIKTISTNLVLKFTNISNTILIEENLLISTKSGLFLTQENRINLLRQGEFYGIAIDLDDVYVFQKTMRTGRILKFKKGLKLYEIFIDDLSKGCHQIDLFEGNLYITDTYNNRILKYNLKAELLDEFYPIGKLSNKRNSNNYGHINSIFIIDKDNIALLCHNESTKTKKNSEILVCNSAFEVKQVYLTEAKNAHNIYYDPVKKNFILNDSIGGRLLWNNNISFQNNRFLRGLSMTDKYNYIGDSDYSKRIYRNFSRGGITVCTKKWEPILRVKIPGMVQEIRCMDVDYCQSQFSYDLQRKT